MPYRLLCFCLALLTAQSFAAESGTVRIADKTFTVEIADTIAARQLGLSGRSALERDSGMLLVFARSGYYRIWMKEMHFSLDVLWVNQFGSVVHIERGLRPASYPQTFVSNQPAMYILEVPAGAAASLTVNMPVYFENIMR